MYDLGHGIHTGGLSCSPLATVISWYMQHTHPHAFWVVRQALQPLFDNVPVFLPLPFAEYDLQKVPRPADERHAKQLPLSQHLGALQGAGRPVASVRGGEGLARSPDSHPRGQALLFLVQSTCYNWGLGLWISTPQAHSGKGTSETVQESNFGRRAGAPRHGG